MKQRQHDRPRSCSPRPRPLRRRSSRRPGPPCWKRPSRASASRSPSRPADQWRYPDQIFDPKASRYVIDGDDLVVTPAQGGVVVLDHFFGRPTTRPPSRCWAALRSPPTSCSPGPTLPARRPSRWWWPRSRCRATRPGEGHGAHKVLAGGGAGFAPYDPGDLGPGLEPLGPLGPASLSYSAEFPPLHDAFGADNGNDNVEFGAAPPPPAGGEPVLPSEPVTPETPAPWPRRSSRPVPPWASWPNWTIRSSFNPPSMIPGWSSGSSSAPTGSTASTPPTSPSTRDATCRWRSSTRWRG